MFFLLLLTTYPCLGFAYTIKQEWLTGIIRIQIRFTVKCKETVHPQDRIEQRHTAPHATTLSGQLTATKQPALLAMLLASGDSASGLKHVLNLFKQLPRDRLLRKEYLEVITLVI